MTDNLEYICKECDFNWITLNGEHKMCPKCHSETIEYVGKVEGLDVDSILNHNKRMGGCCESTRGRGPMTCGKPYPDHHDPNIPHNPKKCCGHRVY
ncbi:MAG: DNA-binding protein [Methanobrevibacter sp.]